ncbi:protein Hikeshi [Pelomyxa schiedti]|nr:protein Hikeshi [Pelomyxa schiedti]
MMQQPGLSTTTMPTATPSAQLQFTPQTGAQTTNLFGCIVAGRMVNTTAVQVDVAKCVFTLQHDTAHPINHIVVFLTGVAPLPPGYGAALFLAWPPDYTKWDFHGFISNDKPSAVFRVSNSSPTSGEMVDASQPPTQLPPVQLGISVESMTSIQERWQFTQSNNATARSSSVEDSTNMPLKLLENFYNFAMSFSTKNPQIVNAPGQDYIPASVLNKWYQTAHHRIMKESGAL